MAHKMLPKTSERVSRHTDADINARIEPQIERNLLCFADHSDEIPQRLAELDAEWDIERALEAVAATAALVGVLLAGARGARYLLLPATVAEAGDTTRPSEGIGDEAITWYLANIGKIERGRDIVLVLLEDAPFGDGSLMSQNPEVAILSTRAFLRTLQNCGLIASADAIIKKVEDNSAGQRKMAPYMADWPGRLACNHAYPVG